MIIALLTDFGTKDYFAAALKASILRINPIVSIVDITHEISRHSISEGSFTLAACYRDFPENTIFLTVVDPGVGSERKAILVKTEKYYFVAPDNGILTAILDEEPHFQAVCFEKRELMNSTISQTFHGRDIFAPAAAWLSQGKPLSDFGKVITELVRIDLPKVFYGNESEIVGSIIHIDDFGNLISNIRLDQVNKEFTVSIGGDLIEKTCTNYADAPQGKPFTIWGSAGFLEISVNQKSAAQLLDAKIGDRLTLNIRKT